MHIPEHVEKNAPELSNEEILKRIDQLIQQQHKEPRVSNTIQRDNRRKVRCYKYKGLGHVQRNCPLNNNQSTKRASGKREIDSTIDVKRVGRFCDKRSVQNGNRRRQRPISVGSNTSPQQTVEAGMYLSVSVFGVKTSMLIDSGATASLLSTDMYYSKPADRRPSLKPVRGEMVAINGMTLEILGSGDFDIDVAESCYPSTFFVAKLNTTGILGLDFLSAHDCDINMNHKAIVLDGKMIKCTIKGKNGCYRVSLGETISIPPHHEIITSGQINEFCNDIEGIGIIEPTEKFCKNGQALIGRILVTARESVPIRLMNPSNEPVVVHKGTIVGQFEQVESIPAPQSPVSRISVALAEPLKDLLNQCSGSLSDSQIH